MKKVLIISNKNITNYTNYASAIEACGAMAVESTCCGSVNIVKDVDGILIPGGTDINPALYREENIDSRETDDQLDRFEMDIIEEAVRLQKPILGICRGLQILNVFFGGTLIQNLDTWKDHARENQQDKVHMSIVEKETFLYEIYQAEKISINSAHHQAVAQLGKGLKTVQFSEDHVVEAFYHTELPILGVQWHPERMCLKNARTDTVDGLKVFDYYVNKLVKNG